MLTTTLDERPITIGDAARRLNRSSSTLRTWEARGILSPILRTADGVRLYSPTQVEALRVRLEARTRKAVH